MEGQVAIVTGGAQGIGKAYVKVLLTRKVKVVIVDLDLVKGQGAVSELETQYPNSRVSFERCDVTDDEQLSDVFKRTRDLFGRIDILVNNAAVIDESNPDLVIAVNVRAVVRGTQLALKYMSKQEGGLGGNIVSTSSLHGLFPSARTAVYSATKFAIVGYMRSVGASSMEDHNVRVNCICPNTTDTGLLNLKEHQIVGGKEGLKVVQERLAEEEFLNPDTVAACLPLLLDDVTLSGAVMMCTPEQPHALLKLPADLQDLYGLMR